LWHTAYRSASESPWRLRAARPLIAAVGGARVGAGAAFGGVERVAVGGIERIGAVATLEGAGGSGQVRAQLIVSRATDRVLDVGGERVGSGVATGQGRGGA
jgi:hypothetical protein